GRDRRRSGPGGGQAPEAGDEADREYPGGGHENEEGGVGARPLPTGAFDSPGCPERREHDTDHKFHAVFRYPRQRCADRDSGAGADRDGADGGDGGETDVVLVAAEGDRDEGDFEALEKDALERQGERVPVGYGTDPPGGRRTRGGEFAV